MGDRRTLQAKKIESKVSVARKRDETSDLIKEVLAQRDALEKRISALEDGLKVSSDLVDKPVSELETEMSEIDGKLEIAQERLEHLEQEEYFEELGRKLSGKEEDSGNNEDFSQSDFIDYETSDTESQHDSESEIAEKQSPNRRSITFTFISHRTLRNSNKNPDRNYEIHPKPYSSI